MTNEEAPQLARLTTLVQDMHTRLFGNGQPGIIKEMKDDIDELKVYRTYARIAGLAIITFLAGITTALSEHVFRGKP